MRILIIEDDLTLCGSLKYQFEHRGVSVDVCHNGEEGLDFIREGSHDVILLDRMIPVMDGTQVLKKMRSEHISVPVIFITALGDLYDKIQGLDCGADDYIVKPFDFEELMARIRCIIRRPQVWAVIKPLTFGDISYDTEQKKLSGNNLSCTLSRREGDLLETFLKNPGQIIPRLNILSRVWGMGAEVEDGNLDNYIHLLRRRLGTVESKLTLKTIRGIGYSLVDTDV